jgi:hypothetical protein
VVSATGRLIVAIGLSKSRTSPARDAPLPLRAMSSFARAKRFRKIFRTAQLQGAPGEENFHFVE